MILSLCIPIMNRAYALRKALPLIVEAANKSAPIEIVIVDYSSSDDLQAYLREVIWWPLERGVFWTLVSCTGHPYFQMAHARNLCVVASHGEYILQLSAEALPTPNAFQVLRGAIESRHPVWGCEGADFGRWILCKRSEFVAAGGYDERFTDYSPEDREICARLHRRGGSFFHFSPDLINEIPTENDAKMANYDLTKYKDAVWVKRQMSWAMHKILDEDNTNEILVANPEGWGKWI